MLQKKETTRTTEKKPSVEVQDLAAKKDAKGGGFKFPGPHLSPEGIKNP